MVRVYNMKLEELLDDIRSGCVFGAVSAGMYLCLLNVYPLFGGMQADMYVLPFFFFFMFSVAYC